MAKSEFTDSDKDKLFAYVQGLQDKAKKAGKKITIPEALQRSLKELEPWKSSGMSLATLMSNFTYWKGKRAGKPYLKTKKQLQETKAAPTPSLPRGSMEDLLDRALEIKRAAGLTGNDREALRVLEKILDA